MLTIPAAAGTAVLVLLAGSLPWGPLFARNLLVGVTVPWAVLPMAIYLSAYWMVVSGRWSGAGGAERRLRLRANALSWSMWSRSLAAGLVGFAAILALLVLVARLVALPDASPITTPAAMPLVTGVTLLVMQSVVAGVAEEAAFRGYMQSMVEQRCGVVMAILAQGALFGILHAPNHPGAVFLMLPYYIAVSAVYGGLTWAADSILPALVLHVGGDAVVLIRWWLTGKPEWQIGPAVPVHVRPSGVDAAFIATVIVAVALVAGTAAACLAVRRRRLREAAVPG
jgi:membrane protease YdiL (CAAX protease family)